MEEWQIYVKDSRTICKYGVKCYQKNADHHKHFKHPPSNILKKDRTRNHRRNSPYSRNTSPKNTPKASSDQDDVCDIANSSTPSSNKTQQLQTNKPPENHPEEDNSVLLNVADLFYHDQTTDIEVFKELFLVQMPNDFFEFYNFLKESNNDVQSFLSSVNLELIGPFDLLLGKLPILKDKDLYLLHWRFFYDPPEYQAILKKKGKSQYHIGYYRDQPNENPVFLASSDSSKGCHITPLADNIFGTIYLYLQNEKKTSPFTAMSCQKFMDKIKKCAEEKKYSLEEYNIKKRLSHVLAKTLHGSGLVVPYNKKTQLGYRKLVETDANLKKLFTKLEEAKSDNEKDVILSEIQPVITYANIAVDECDFGTGLEMGIDLFCSGLKELEPSALSTLCSVYPLLNRNAFSKIIEVHLKNRRKGPNMSVLSLISK